MFFENAYFEKTRMAHTDLMFVNAGENTNQMVYDIMFSILASHIRSSGSRDLVPQVYLCGLCTICTLMHESKGWIRIYIIPSGWIDASAFS